MLAILFELLGLADVAQDKHRSSARLTLLQPGVADGDPDDRRLIQTRWIQIRCMQLGEKEFGLLARPARPVERRRERAGQRRHRFEASAQQTRRLGIEHRNPFPRFDHQNAARQAFHDAPQAFADAVVLFETGSKIAVGDFQFLAQMRHLPLQLSVGTLQ